MVLDIKFEEQFKIATFSLRANRAHPSVKRDIVWILQFSFYFSITLFCFFNLAYSIFVHDIVNGNFADASKNGTILIVCITISLKYYVLVRNQQNFVELINYLETDFKSAKQFSIEDQKVVQKYAEYGTRCCMYWLVFGFGTSIIFPIEAFIRTVYSYWEGNFRLVPMFELTYIEPLESYKEETTVFFLLFTINSVFGLYASSMYMGFDTLVLIFMLHVSGQLKLLSRRMETVFNDPNDIEGIKQELQNIIKKLQSLYEFMDYVKNNFAWLYEIIMKVTTILLPLTSFQIMDDLRNGKVNVQFMSFFVGCFLHFYLPSCYSDLLMDMSEEFRQAIYSSGWEKCPDKQTRQIILFMMTRALRPMEIRTIFYEINLDTFSEMCRQSYTIFNLMNAAWT